MCTLFESKLTQTPSEQTKMVHRNTNRKSDCGIAVFLADYQC